MMFSKVLPLALAFVPLSQAAALNVERQTTPAQTIAGSLSLLQTTANQNEAAILDSVDNAKNNVGAGGAAAVAAQVNANLAAIVQGFQTAAKQINASITNAGTGAGGLGSALAQTEIDGLTASLTTLQNIITGISASIYFSATNLRPAIRQGISDEVAVLANAVAPVVNPVMVFASAASKASAQAGASVQGLRNAYTGVNLIASRFATDNGVSGVAFPGYPAVPTSISS